MSTYPNISNEPELLKINSKDDELKKIWRTKVENMIMKI